MLRMFSSSCLSLEDMDTVLRPNLVRRPHVLGPGADFFTEDGEPVRPQPGMFTFQKVFSGSALDLNALGADAEEEPRSPAGSPQQPRGTVPVGTLLEQLSSEADKAKNAKSKTQVLVIGDNGYVSTHVIERLLETGYTVRVTVPSGSARQKQQADLYCMNRDAAASRLSIVETNILNSTALRDAIRGCRYIIHCGCPNTALKDKSPIAYHTQAVQALFDGIRLSGKSTVKRVIVTGAVSSVFHITDPDQATGTFDESCLNTVATAATDPIPFAKIVFEKEAWRLRQMLGVELVVLLPSIPIGPSRTEETSEAMVAIQSLASAPAYFPFCPSIYWNFVDIRDVAEAHVRALEAPEVKDQRVIISTQCLNLSDVSKIIKRRFPHLTPPTRRANKLLTLLIGATQSGRGVNLRFLWRSLGVRKALDSSRATTELKMTFTPIEETIGACVQQMIDAGELPARAESQRCGLKVAAALSVVAALGAAAAVVLRSKARH